MVIFVLFIDRLCMFIFFIDWTDTQSQCYQDVCISCVHDRGYFEKVFKQLRNHNDIMKKIWTSVKHKFNAILYKINLNTKSNGFHFRFMSEDGYNNFLSEVCNGCNGFVYKLFQGTQFDNVRTCNFLLDDNNPKGHSNRSSNINVSIPEKQHPVPTTRTRTISEESSSGISTVYILRYVLVINGFKVLFKKKKKPKK